MHIKITRAIGENKIKLPAIELPKRKIRVSQNRYVGTFDKNGEIIVYLPTCNKTDNLLSVKFNIEEYRNAAIETANKHAGIHRFINQKADKAIKEWISNAPTPRARYSRQAEYDDIGCSFFADIIKSLTKRLVEKVGIKIESSYQVFLAKKNMKV